MKYGIVILFVVIVFFSGCTDDSSDDSTALAADRITEDEAIYIANRTDEARMFLNLYPDSKIDAHTSCCAEIVISEGLCKCAVNSDLDWVVVYWNDDIWVDGESLRVAVGSDGEILSIYPNIEDIQNEINVSVITDKSEYRRGETISAMFEFDDGVYVNPYFKVYYYANHSWNFVGMWNVDGRQYTCCGAFSMCEWFNVTQSPIEFVWDQMIVDASLPVMPGDDVVGRLANPGKYRLTAVYGDEAVCTDSVDVEFLIG